MKRTIKIPNKDGEKLDVLIEGNSDSKTTIVFVHGLGVTKDESFQYFIDISNELQRMYRIVRFDFSGYGLSEGRQEDANLSKHANDLDEILKHVKKSFSGNVFLLAHSMGCFVTLQLNPKNITKTVFTGMPNHNVGYIKDRLVKRILSRKGSSLDINGVSIFPRSSGEVQKIGSSFWKALERFDPLKKVLEFSKKTKLLIIHPSQDDVVGTEFLGRYNEILSINSIWLPGDHSFQNKEHRNRVIEEIKIFYSS